MKNKNTILTVLFAGVFAFLSVLCIIKPQSEFSDSERRPLAKMPEVSADAVLSGEFMDGFEEYSTDQFPFRDDFRTIKAYFSQYVLGKKDNNGLYMADGHVSKIEYPENPDMADYAAERFNYLYNTYMKDKNMNVYLSIVPDKNYFLAKENGYLSIDYDGFIKDFKSRVPYMEYIDIFPMLSADDYYKTDSHWKQENIVDVAQFIAKSMGTDAETDYEENILDTPFYGVYSGQSALRVAPDTIKYLTNQGLENAKVTYYSNGVPETGDMYDFKKAQGKDSYEIFLSGTTPLVTIENPDADTDRELILFRDSFGSSIAPLLSSAYKKITIADIRYIQSGFLGNFIEFKNQDVLFLYSTTLLNNSMAMR